MRAYEHQAREFREAWQAESRALLWQMRTGKTKAVIDSARALWQALEIGGVVVVAPNGVHRQWAEVEVPAHAPDSRTFAYRLSAANNARDFGQWVAAGHKRLNWLCVNMESLIRLEVQAAIKTFKKTYGRCMLVADESHHFARAGSKRTAVIRGLARQFEYRRILTGTPIEETPMQAFTQFEILEREALGCRTFGQFQATYAVMGQGYGPGGRRFPKIEGYQRLDELRLKMAKYSSVVLRSDCGDLPSLQVDRRISEMTPDQARLWHAIKEQELEKLDNMEYDGPIAGGAAFVKLQQVEGGFLRRENGDVASVCEEKIGPKMLILLDEIEQYDGQVISWFQFVHELEAAHEALNGTASRYHGKMRDADRAESLKNYRAGKTRVLLATPQSAGEGLKLPGGKIVWYSQTPSARLRMQAGERATVMGGQSVQMVDIVAPGGVDDHYNRMAIDKSLRADGMTREGMRRILMDMGV